MIFYLSVPRLEYESEEEEDETEDEGDEVDGEEEALGGAAELTLLSRVGRGRHCVAFSNLGLCCTFFHDQLVI